LGQAAPIPKLGPVTYSPTMENDVPSFNRQKKHYYLKNYEQQFTIQKNNILFSQSTLVNYNYTNYNTEIQYDKLNYRLQQYPHITFTT